MSSKIEVPVSVSELESSNCDQISGIFFFTSAVWLENEEITTTIMILSLPDSSPPFLGLTPANIPNTWPEIRFPSLCFDILQSALSEK